MLQFQAYKQRTGCKQRFTACKIGLRLARLPLDPNMYEGVPEVKMTYAVLQHSLKRVSLRAPRPGIRRTISLWVKKFLRTRLYI